MFMTGAYHAVRLPPDLRRDKVWAALWCHYFSARIRSQDCVADFGCGYGHFINHVVARRRIALDSWPEFTRFIAPGIECITGSLDKLADIPDHSIDYAFASNVAEHITKDEFAAFLAQLTTKLTPEGTLTLLQPNYRFAYREYFDDYTHISVYSHISLHDFLEAHGYEVLEMHPRFLPLSVKSRLPVASFFIWLYLYLPFRPLGKQMLVRARPHRHADRDVAVSTR